MPCEDTYPHDRHNRMVETCKLIEIICQNLNISCEKWILEVKNSGYHMKDEFLCMDKLNEVTKILCDLCKENENLVYSCKDKYLRKVAVWWDEHKEMDNKRLKEERESYERMFGKKYEET